MRIVAACVALLMGVPAAASADNFVRTVPAGQKTKMHLYLSWKTKDCSPNKAIVKVLTKPLHGKLTAGDGEGRAQRSRHTKDDPCIGKMMKGLQVEYESELGYRGSDNFQIQVTFGNRRPEIDTYIVRVN